MNILNDHNCGWINQLPKRTANKSLDRDLKCDYLIVGAGYTGLSAARSISNIKKNEKIIIVDAQLAGEGGSSRNSGYLVDTTLNDGFSSDRDIHRYKKKVKLYELGIKAVKEFIKKYQIQCDFNECGKYFASSKIEDENIVKSFSKILSELNFKNKIIYNDDLKKKLGTKFYKLALYTSGGALLHPGKLARAMVDTLSDNVQLFENTQLLNWKKNNDKIFCKFKNFEIQADKIIFCTNGFLRSMKVKKNYSFPITLTASMTRELTKNEFESIGTPKEWGVLPIRQLGATVRLTKDNRILIRNTAELRNPEFMNIKDLKKRVKLHELGISKRFPKLPKNIIESSWSGIVCRSGNSSQIFEKIDEKIYAVGCYNGSGIGVGTLFGEQIGLIATNQDSDEIKIIQDRLKPNLLPPQPILNIGIRARLFYEKIKARSEI